MSYTANSGIVICSIDLTEEEMASLKNKTIVIDNRLYGFRFDERKQEGTFYWINNYQRTFYRINNYQINTRAECVEFFKEGNDFVFLVTTTSFVKLLKLVIKELFQKEVILMTHPVVKLSENEFQEYKNAVEKIIQENVLLETDITGSVFSFQKNEVRYYIKYYIVGIIMFGLGHEKNEVKEIYHWLKEIDQYLSVFKKRHNHLEKERGAG